MRSSLSSQTKLKSAIMSALTAYNCWKGIENTTYDSKSARVVCVCSWVVHVRATHENARRGRQRTDQMCQTILHADICVDATLLISQCNVRPTGKHRCIPIRRRSDAHWCGKLNLKAASRSDKSSSDNSSCITQACMACKSAHAQLAHLHVQFAMDVCTCPRLS